MKGLTAFERFGDIRDEFVADAEIDPAILASSSRPARILTGIGHFFNRPLGIAIVCAVVSLGVIGALIRAGLPASMGNESADTMAGNNTLAGEDLMPEAGTVAGNGLTSSADTCDYTVATDKTAYPIGTTKIDIVITGKEKGKVIEPVNSWKVVKISGEADPEGADFIWIEIGFGPVMPPEDAYAKMDFYVSLVNADSFTPGRYRLYNMNYDGSYLAYCEFELYEGDEPPAVATDAPADGTLVGETTPPYSP